MSDRAVSPLARRDPAQSLQARGLQESQGNQPVAPPIKIGRLAELQREVKIPEPYVLTSKITIKNPTRGQMKAIRAAKNDDESDKAFFGDQYDAVNALFDDRPEQEWKAFAKDIYEHFFGKGADDVEGKPEDSSE